MSTEPNNASNGAASLSDSKSSASQQAPSDKSASNPPSASSGSAQDDSKSSPPPPQEIDIDKIVFDKPAENKFSSPTPDNGGYNNFEHTVSRPPSATSTTSGYCIIDQPPVTTTQSTDPSAPFDKRASGASVVSAGYNEFDKRPVLPYNGFGHRPVSASSANSAAPTVEGEEDDDRDPTQ